MSGNMFDYNILEMVLRNFHIFYIEKFDFIEES